MRVRLTIEYDGSAFHGWQSQIGARTVQDELRRAVSVVVGSEVRRPIAAGRTDSGVHARGQVVHIDLPDDTDLDKLQGAVSGLLRGELAVLSVERVPETFHARFDVETKQYRYEVVNRRAPLVLEKGHAWQISSELNDQAMLEAVTTVRGTHDFTSFRGAGCGAKSPVRSIQRCELARSGDRLTFYFEGEGFLRQMVRNLVGTVIWIGMGRITASMQELLERKDRRCSGPCAPGYGLYLDWVRYRNEPYSAEDMDDVVD